MQRCSKVEIWYVCDYLSRHVSYRFQHRTEASNEARNLDHKLRDLYSRHPNFVLIPSSASFVEKILSFVLSMTNFCWSLRIVLSNLFQSFWKRWRMEMGLTSICNRWLLFLWLLLWLCSSNYLSIHDNSHVRRHCYHLPVVNGFARYKYREI